MPAFRKAERRRQNAPRTQIGPAPAPIRPSGPVRSGATYARPFRNPDPPASWVGSLPEWWVYWWLWKRRGLEPGVDFQYQGQVEGGRRQPGGLVPDFVIYGGVRPIAVNVQGLYWHLGTAAHLAATRREEAQYLAAGYDYVPVYEDDLRDHLEHVMSEALAGRRVGNRPLPF